MDTSLIIEGAYFTAALLFIYGLKRMASPKTARSGIVVAGWGMVLAVVVAFLYGLDVNERAQPHVVLNLALVMIALGLGVGWAWYSGKKVAMTDMPQMVALYNGMGGGAAAAIAAIELFSGNAQSHGVVVSVLAVLGGLIGAVALSGSLVAWAKLDGRMSKTIRLPGQQAINAVLFFAALGLGAAITTAGVTGGEVSMLMISLFFILALVLGVMLTTPIGGADMPVVISLYNAFTGLAVAFEGFVLQNPAMIIAGTVVGSAGTLLTLMMAKAMNRPVSNVIFSQFGESGGEGDSDIEGSMKSAEASDAAIAMYYASKVIIVPGYGLAVAQAQHKLYEFVKLLQKQGVDVKFAIHPVAGRMPGHMNVLLAEAGVPYDIIHDLEDINEDFAQADVAIVLGANDVVNPAARTRKSSPIYGMPILNVDMAHQAYVVKRGQGKGYSGVENELFYAENTSMVYGDAQKVMSQMIEAVKSLG
ncbi:NAD(P)(+) transhydrogenase (Re/Si-specific) subunit beta [Halopseudomonas pelagia]|uniref:NAD(P) transhydrogenase subunit beta n=1 Tax=Halopseudomonas pelagia TaxID=553151 RepID=A0AA91Z802_9GAMM|nr:NAD(P)(+) transhydrogenase (Re/Si-specific) subunit beta [Halopseudomonas pelagia]PCD00981.1 NAD(P) transhydrogenase subunit beta [Halopseudomonas pelagia]QFY57232.1 NAD(P)(+) transhydrogenase (Re/Si-specific) subunit beta [Halopseudomonas pelagia]